ncbi:head scaffolding protein [Bacillus phage VMY22]|uniref:Capsid and scaffold protein n=1 Tax=Bacillus phage VMY22 TaxID=1734382 RepID=A0A0N9SHR6_9CAUD|nr:head scaffolding protein [Bacillus phage VMY22]ALH46477.1 capsid and scaffold protein [Bacillus phage VMY22]
MLTRERHEEILNSLNDPELSHTDRAELLGELRSGHTEGMTTIQTNTSHISDLEKENTDLVKLNSKMFREQGIVTQVNDDDERVDSEALSVENLIQESGN